MLRFIFQFVCLFEEGLETSNQFNFYFLLAQSHFPGMRQKKIHFKLFF